MQQNKEDVLVKTEKYYSIKRIYNKYQELSMVQVLDNRGRIYKCMFYDDNTRLSSVCIYNPTSGKEVKNVTYRSDGKTISSVREYDKDKGTPLNVTFFKEDGKTISSLIEYNDSGNEAKFSLYCDNGEIISSAI